MRRAPAIVTLSALSALAALAVTAAPRAAAEPWVFKYDEFPDGLSQAAAVIDGGQFYTQPGFVKGESFGQIYRPAPEMFPMQINGFDLILAAPPNASGALYTNATIEVYNSDSKTADPGNAPIFSISTADLFNPTTQELGFPLQGNVGISIQFDTNDDQNRPPMLTGGNIWLMVRFDDDAMSLSSEWNSIQCFQVEGLICGCQNVGTVHDSDITPKVNVLHVVSPIGQCSGSTMTWTYMENVPATDTGFTIDGDVILRLRADVAEAPCEAACDGLLCGDDGCGGSCGECGADKFCVDGACVSCQPNCLSKQCGDDGCGGSCGTCGATQDCGADFFCHDRCTPDCTGPGGASIVCGDDHCGGSCGTCDAGESCSAGKCEAACVRACDGKQCGPDGCGGACGTCGDGTSCVGGECVAPCAPACANKACGDDGCGGTCGTCDAGDACDAGKCTPTVATTFDVVAISPASGFAIQPTLVSITGHGFMPGAQVKVGGTDCSGEEVTGDTLIAATVPGLPVGSYSVIVVNPDERVATLSNAFEVNPVDLIDPHGGSSDGGCAGGAGGLVAGGIASLIFIGLALRRRWHTSPE